LPHQRLHRGSCSRRFAERSAGGCLEAIVNRPAPSFDGDQHRSRRAGGAPGGEKGQIAINDIAADQKTSRSRTGQGLVVFGRFKIGQFWTGPVEQPLALAAGSADKRRQAEGSSTPAITATTPATGAWHPKTWHPKN